MEDHIFQNGNIEKIQHLLNTGFDVNQINDYFISITTPNFEVSNLDVDFLCTTDTPSDKFLLRNITGYDIHSAFKTFKNIKYISNISS